MGLKEKQLTKTLQESTVPEFERLINSIAGNAKIVLNVDWESFQSSSAGLSGLQDNILTPLVEAMRSVCTSDMAREAVQEGIRTISIKNVVDKPEEMMTDLKDGQLMLHANWGGDAKLLPTEDELTALLEDKL